MFQSLSQELFHVAKMSGIKALSDMKVVESPIFKTRYRGYKMKTPHPLQKKINQPNLDTHSLLMNQNVGVIYYGQNSEKENLAEH